MYYFKLAGFLLAATLGRPFLYDQSERRVQQHHLSLSGGRVSGICAHRTCGASRTDPTGAPLRRLLCPRKSL